jgi:hypothetical protein
MRKKSIHKPKHCAVCYDIFYPIGTSRTKYCYKIHIAECKYCGKFFNCISNSGTSEVMEFCTPRCSGRYGRSNQERLFELKVCEICNSNFKPTSPNQKYCTNSHYKNCTVCGEIVEMSGSIHKWEDLNVRCSKRCINKHREFVNFERFGVPHAIQSEIIKSKRRNTWLSKYGKEEYFSSDDFWDKYQKISIEKYGTDWPMQNDIIKIKSIESRLSKYGRNAFISKVNLMFGEQLSKRGINYTHEFRLYTRLYDFHISDTNILIEINPTYTHSIIPNHWGGFCSINYHQDKTLHANNYGYICIHIFDWDDWNSIISKILGKFTMSDIVEPRLHWFNDTKSIHSCEAHVTESEMLEQGYLPVYDAGQIVIGG